VVEDKCPRCVQREFQRDEKLDATLDGDETMSVVEGKAVYDAGDELSPDEQEVLLGDIRAQVKEN
jgi:hypothetical protein